MMQPGLHVGIAAWIHQQQASVAFAAYPSEPIATQLVHLEAVRDLHDLAKAAEFARLVNFVPRKGLQADAFSASEVLWDVHRTLLARMDFATMPWTPGERAEYAAARETLYDADASGLPTPSAKLDLYQEMKAAYRDVVDSGAGPQEVAQAMSDWMVLGHKQAIEDALEVMSRLSGQSSRTHAQNEQNALNASPPGIALRYHGDMEFAPTYFAPLSAIAPDTWMEGRATFSELDSAVGTGAPARDMWRAYRGSRHGEVAFEYVVLTCIRPWYSPSLYEADDWRLRPGDAEVSRGDGSSGRMPAYVDRVYVARVTNVTIKPAPRPAIPVHVALVAARAPVLRASSKSAGMAKSLATHRTSAGVIRSASPASVRMQPMERSRPVLSTGAAGSAALRRAAPTGFAALRLGSVRRVTSLDVSRRYAIASALLEGAATPAPTEPTDRGTIYVAGFGCETIPTAPNPNSSYEWT